MSQISKGAFLALALSGSVAAVGLATNSAQADSAVISIGPGPGIAYGYNDGYWDRDHKWHDWRDREEAEKWRAENRDHFYAWNHDRDRDMGWRESDHWWDEHR